jgi:2-polyprenyl-3-methyl-5-hydroxy-6-metoxy-1,4-benzoquinol methylase
MFPDRSLQPELLDGDVAPSELYVNLRELDAINSMLGGYRTSLNALKKVLNRTREFIIADIGCGGGDTLRKIQAWCLSEHYNVRLQGVDIKKDCVTYSAMHDDTGLIDFIADDYRHYIEHNKVDILHASLFCHHLAEKEIEALIATAVKKKIVLIINDLERHPIAYYSIRLLTRLFSDAPLSVLRGFKTREWNRLIRNAGATRYSVRRSWAFRHEVIIYG